MNGDRLARLSLRIDGIYCMAVGLIVALSTPFSAVSLGLPPLLVVAVGVATGAWGVYVLLLSNARPLRARTQLVMIANILASAALAVTGLVAGTVVLSVAATVLAVDVAAFAVAQGLALRRMDRPAM